MSNSELVTLCCLYSFWRQKVTQEPLPSKKCLQDLLSSGIVTQVPTKSSRHPPSPPDLCCHLLCCTGNEPEQMNPSEPLEFFHQEQVFCSGLVLCQTKSKWLIERTHKCWVQNSASSGSTRMHVWGDGALRVAQLLWFPAFWIGRCWVHIKEHIKLFSVAFTNWPKASTCVKACAKVCEGARKVYSFISRSALRIQWYSLSIFTYHWLQFSWETGHLKRTYLTSSSSPQRTAGNPS